MRQVILLVQDMNFAESGNSYWKCEAFDITLVRLEDELDLKRKIREHDPEVRYLKAWTDPDQERVLNLGKWWCEDHKFEWLTTLENRPLPEPLRLLIDAEVFKDIPTENATAAAAVIAYKRMVYQFAQDLIANESNAVPNETYLEQYQEGVDILQGLMGKLEHALALQYLRRHPRHPVIYEELIEVSSFKVNNCAQRFRIICENYALEAQTLMPIFGWLHTQITKKVLTEAVEANPVKSVEYRRQEWQAGAAAVLEGIYARNGSMLLLDGRDWCKLAIKRHLATLLKEIF